MYSNPRLITAAGRLSVGIAFVVSGLVFATIASTHWKYAGTNVQKKDRVVTNKRWQSDPVSIVAVKTKKRENIEIAKNFDDEDDWLDGFTVTIVNNSPKRVTAITVEMVFRRDAGDSRSAAVEELQFGPPAMTRHYLQRDPLKFVNSGQRVEISLTPENYQGVKSLLKQTGYQNVTRVELRIREVGFEDGSVFHTGTMWVQDPRFPDDPTKKIPQLKPRLHHASSLRQPAVWLDRNQEECFAKWRTRERYCDQGLNCFVMQDQLQPFDEGYFTTEPVIERCKEYLPNGSLVSCSVGQLAELQDTDRYVECCHPLGCFDPDADCCGLLHWLP
jgi:hypothetical protein